MATYVYGTLKCNGSTMLSGRSKSVTLTGDETTITFARTNVSDCDDSEIKPLCNDLRIELY